MREVEINDNLLQAHYKYDDKYVQNNYKTNIFIAAFTTAWARIKLYDALEYLGEQVLYYDTYSIIYKYMPYSDDKEIETFDNRLGYFKDELGECKYINEFVSGGPKNYAYKMNNGETNCKVKGVTLNYKNSEAVNFDSVKYFILDNILGSKMLGTIFTENIYIYTEQMQFKKDTKDKSITTKYLDKKYSFCYDKCYIVVDDNKPNIIDTLPFYHIRINKY